ncbi:MAG: alkaline phosphatase family protein [Salibacteraceae bacterium]
MNRFILSLFALSLTTAVYAQQAPHLVVGIVVDQMRTDYIYRYWDKYTDDGFKRLIQHGYFFRNAHFNYIPTYTGPGHASIYTGTTPMNHGIISNTWFDKTSKAYLYCKDDSTVQCVGTNKCNSEMSPRNLLTPGIGDVIRLRDNFKGKSFGISIKDRGAILPAGHSGNGAFWFDYETGEFVTSTYYMKSLPGWLKKFNSKNHTTKLMKDGWTPLLAIEKYTESTADNTPYEKSLNPSSPPVFPYDIEQAVKEKGYYAFASTPMANTLLRMLAEEIIVEENLGMDDHTDLLAISFSSTDIIGHAYGPQSIEIEDTYLRLDLEIAHLLKWLDQKVGEGNYLLFLTADHAAAPVPQYTKDNGFLVNYINDDELDTKLRDHIKTVFGADLILSFSNEQIFIDHEQCANLGLNANGVAETAKAFLLKQEGVGNVFLGKELQCAVPANDFVRLAANGYNQKRSGDLVFQYLPGWLAYGKQGTTHGSAYTYDTHVPLIFFGYGVTPGETTQYVEVTQISPTLCMICQLSLPYASDKRPLTFD